jgi:glycosyltransferase involved in cell wall biosynthesis
MSELPSMVRHSSFDIQHSSWPRVSILLPARNAAATLCACLASISRQTETTWECVVVDDGSTDDTAALARQAAARDRRFRVVRAGTGLIPALNEGFRHCRASLIARMDADDLMHRERLASQVQALDADSTLAGVGCHVRLFPRRHLTERHREYEGWLNSMRSAEDVRRDAFIECPVAHPSLMVRRQVLESGYLDRGWPEDYDLVLRILAGGRRLGVVPRRLLWWRDSPGRASRTASRYAVQCFTACKAHFLARGFLTSDTYVLWGYGSTGRALRRALSRLGKSPSHIVEVKRTRIGQRIHGAPVIPPEDVRGLRGRPLVVSVARGGPRAAIRAALAGLGFVETRDYICAA